MNKSDYTRIKDHPLYRTWRGMRKRCNSPTRRDYPNYGGRGISVCSRWDDFWAFVADMGERPEGFTIERINNHLGYSPANCRWASAKEQNRNTRRTRLLTFQGRTQCMADWAEELGMPRRTLRTRIWELGWSVEKALTTPLIDRARLLTFQGRTQGVRAWARELGMPHPTLLTRINRLGWSVEKALSTPISRTDSSGAGTSD